MAIAKLVPATSTGDSLTGVGAAAVKRLYQANKKFITGMYSITCNTGIITYVKFIAADGSEIIQVNTTSGAVSLALTTEATSVRFWYTGGTGNQSINITRVGNLPIDNAFTSSTTVEVLTTSGTYTGTSSSGYAYVVAVGGGGGGGGGNHNCCPSGAGGGGSGGLAGGQVALTGSVAYTVGAPGASGPCCSAAGGDGGATTIGNVTANGGQGGRGSSGGTGAAGGAGGLPGGATGGSANDAYNGNAGNISAESPLAFIVEGTTGSGGSQSNNGNGNIGGGSVGGYGYGGRRDAGSWSSGQQGGPGVIYLVKLQKGIK